MIYLLKEYGDFLELMERIFNCRIQIITGPNNEISQQQQNNIKKGTRYKKKKESHSKSKKMETNNFYIARCDMHSISDLKGNN